MPQLYHRLLLLVAAWLAVSGGKPTAAAGAVYSSSPSMCHKSFKCGDNVDIRYPFYLSNQSKVLDAMAYSHSQHYCGYPDMAIICDQRGTATATLQLGGGSNYTVLAINYGNMTISLADADFCPRVRRNVTFPPVNSFETTYTLQLAIDYLSFFYDCAFTSTFTPAVPAAVPWPVGIIPINCSSFEEGPSPAFLVPQLDTPEGDWLIQACKEVYVLPVLGDELFRPEYYSRLGSGGYGQVLKQGFQLNWIGPKGDMACHQCELSNGQCTYDRATGGFLGCLCSDGRMRNPNCGAGLMKKTRKICIIASTSSILVLCLLLFSCLLGCKRYRSRKKSKETPRIESFLQKHAAIHSKRYTYSQVKRMTRNFAEKLGQGGFGVVYRGDLSGGRQIAVKMLKDSKADVEEFINEVASISRTSHVNVVTLLGFCLEGSKRALIYDYMPNGSLERISVLRYLILGWPNCAPIKKVLSPLVTQEEQ
ncbi:hypothetical protein BRADI_4g02168v3 [Brachypodium distachyon]|uniref:Protein kinase domain-containing protein n=1 Tax=Brachypodium distachyon TaxID=15368 RepID=A0A0Q3EE18_BRADI|nr:hypothetical protein BRADI_4g02168v3 [Brachypodium distachyon]